MDKEIITKCGYRCDLCLAYSPNVKVKDQRQFLSDGWYVIYGFRIEPKDIICEGCISSEKPVLIDKNCPVRPCAIEHGINNCSKCSDFICEKLRQRIIIKSDIEEKLNRPLTDQEYNLLVKPYDSKDRLRKLREVLSDN